MISVSRHWERGSAFWRTVPERMKGSWGMVVILERMRERGRVDRSRLSMVIFPDDGSSIRRRRERRVLFPLPVRPQIPIFWPAFMWKDMLDNAGELSLCIG